VVITCSRLQDIKELFASLVEQTKKIEVEINGIKAKFMTVSRKPYNGKEYVKLYAHNIEIVRHYTYVGKILTYKKSKTTD
jgi:hypothetical protein